MLIRRATSADVADLAMLVEQYWEFEAIQGFDRARIESLLRALLAKPEQGAGWIAQAECLCGYLTAAYVFSLEHGGLMAEIDELFVLPQMRSAGVGSLLLSAAERDLAARGVTRLQLQLGKRNERGLLFYRRHGFQRHEGYELLDKPVRSQREMGETI